MRIVDDGDAGAEHFGVERVQKEEVLAANQRAFERIKQEAIRLGIDPADAHMIVQKMELNFTDANVQLLWDPDNLGPQRPPIVPLWENGERKLRGRREDGQRAGRWTWWDDAGGVTARCRYEDGAVVEGRCGGDGAD